MHSVSVHPASSTSPADQSLCIFVLSYHNASQKAALMRSVSVNMQPTSSTFPAHQSLCIFVFVPRCVTEGSVCVLWHAGPDVFSLIGWAVDQSLWRRVRDAVLVQPAHWLRYGVAQVLVGLLTSIAGLLTPLTFTQHCSSPVAVFTFCAYFLHNGRRW